MARILILTLIFRPDNVSTAQIMGDLALDLKEFGHDVFVVTTVPHYNEDLRALNEQPLRPCGGKLVQQSEYHGIKVLHVWMPKKGKNKLLRIIGWIGFHILSTLAALVSRFTPDLILAPSPPLTIGLSAWIIGKWYRAPFVYNVQELYPDIAVNLGILQNPSLINFFGRLERFVYAKARALAVISEGMARRVRFRVSPAEKVRVIPNFVDTDFFRPLPKANPFSIAHGLHEKFVVSYAGNMGAPQGLNTLLDAARLLHIEKEIHFFIMGDGSERESLMKYAQNLHLNNVTFLSYQSYFLMPEAYAATDASFVSQVSGTSDDGIPSKVYRIMACGRPVIACTDAGSDLERLVKETQAGVVVPPGDAQALADAIRTAFQNREVWRAKGLHARDLMLRRFSRRAVGKRYHDLVVELTDPPPATPDNRADEK